MNKRSELKFTILLAVLIILSVIRMTTFGYVRNLFVINVLAAVLIITATLSLCVEKRSRTLALIFGIPAIGLSLCRGVFSGHLEFPFMVATRASCMIFMAFVIAIILRSLLSKAAVTRDSLAGAFCGYILIGVMFAEAYCLLEASVPNSFQAAGMPTLTNQDTLRLWLMLEYFSFTTLTTLGFGDIVPLTFAARILTVWEAACGQFYLAVLVAGLVSLRASRDNNA